VRGDYKRAGSTAEKAIPASEMGRWVMPLAKGVPGHAGRRRPKREPSADDQAMVLFVGNTHATDRFGGSSRDDVEHRCFAEAAMLGECHRASTIALRRSTPWPKEAALVGSGYQAGSARLHRSGVRCERTRGRGAQPPAENVLALPRVEHVDSPRPGNPHLKEFSTTGEDVHHPRRIVAWVLVRVPVVEYQPTERPAVVLQKRLFVADEIATAKLFVAQEFESGTAFPERAPARRQDDVRLEPSGFLP
jgi:hypothetical protein